MDAIADTVWRKERVTNNEYRKSCREFISKGGWKRYGIIEEPPSILDEGKEFEIMYEDMDGESDE